MVEGASEITNNIRSLPSLGSFRGEEEWWFVGKREGEGTQGKEERGEGRENVSLANPVVVISLYPEI